jgi:hypothetical protein
VPGERDDRTHTVAVGWEHVGATIGSGELPGRGALEDGNERVGHDADDTRGSPHARAIHIKPELRAVA